MIYYEDHLVDDEGKRWSLSCDWPPPPGDGIPDFLRLTQEERREGWKEWRYTDAYRGGEIEEWKVRELRYREAIEAEKRAKNLQSLEQMKAKHVGERYDRKQRQWVPIQNMENQP